MVFVNERTEDGNWQTIDRENDVVLTEVSVSGPDENASCELLYKGESVFIRSTYCSWVHGHPKLGESSTMDIHWTILGLGMPHELRSQEEHIKDVIIDCLKEYGWNFRKDKAHSVQVTFK